MQCTIVIKKKKEVLLWVSLKKQRASQVVLVIKNPPANARDLRHLDSIPGLGRSPGGEHGNPLQYPCLGNLVDRRAWWAIVRRVTKSWTGLNQLS